VEGTGASSIPLFPVLLIGDFWIPADYVKEILGFFSHFVSMVGKSSMTLNN
jgi:hypothetical protein